MSDQTPFERLEEIAKEQKRSVRQLVELAGRNPSIVSAIRNGKKELSLELAELIAGKFGYNTEWIVSGSGKRLAAIQGAEVGHQVRPVQVGSSTTELISILKTPLYARTGFGYSTYMNRPPNEQEWDYISPSKLYPGVPAEDHTIVTINGDSMEPMLQAGWEVLAYKKAKGTFPRLNKVVMLDFQDELIIKRLVNVDWVEHTITVQSDNGGAQMRIPMDSIREVYHVYDYYRAQL